MISLATLFPSAFAADGAAALNFTRVGGLLTDEEVRLVRSLLPADDDAAWDLGELP